MANAAEFNMNRESPQKSQNPNTFETVDKATVNTLKVSSRLSINLYSYFGTITFQFHYYIIRTPFLQRNPKIEFCKTDLLKLLTYLEGELQARDIVIATLKVNNCSIIRRIIVLFTRFKLISCLNYSRKN